ncbi:MAG: DUF86 domain-containing protein [Campylobacterota bacterium]|nr:DUF86 domain-containing protein [Campylobacterota bacterium]
MNFKDYLISTIDLANEEKEILDILSSKEVLTKIEIRAVKNSLQVMIENCIGKSKRILKSYDCPIIPQRSKDAIYILYEVGAIDDEQYGNLNSAIGFRNGMIHDYMKFNIDVLYAILKNKLYVDIYNFLVSDVSYNDVIRSRIENYTF